MAIPPRVRRTKHCMLDVYNISTSLVHLSCLLPSSDDKRVELFSSFASTSSGSILNKCACPIVTLIGYQANGTMSLIQAVLSDFIVLWRMCLVWEKNRLAVTFAAIMATTLLVINILNIISLNTDSLPQPTESNDTETIFTYGLTSFGLAAAFLSLASNICATALVALKVWYVVSCPDVRRKSD